MESPKSANKFIFFFLIYSILISLLSSFIPFLFNVDIDLFSKYLIVSQDIFLFLIPIVIYFIISKKKIRDLLPFNKLSLKNGVYVIIITILTLPLLNLFSAVSSFFASNATNDAIFNYINDLPMLVAVFALAVMPAIFEEATCRGILMGNYKTTSVLTMYIISGLFFGIIHMNFQQMAYAIPAGIMFAFFVHQTNSIFASMLSHFFINGYQVIMVKIILNHCDAEYLTNVSMESTSAVSNAIVAIFFLILVVLLAPINIYFIQRFIARNKDNAKEYMKDKAGTNKKIFDIFFILTIIVFILFSVFYEITT